MGEEEVGRFRVTWRDLGSRGRYFTKWKRVRNIVIGP